jgi:outer membrane receptor for ferrienterochelin and colicins
MKVLAIAALVLSAAPFSRAGVPDPPAPTPDLSTLDLEQLMKMEIVVAASKRAQSAREVPSFVTVVTAAEIRAHGYRSLADVLRTLPSFYVSNDRNYTYLGVRGFERAGDYNSRVLLLLNGLRANDNVYDAAALGEEFTLDLDLVERIEVIRGPGATIYGSNAFFAVINVVTRSGRSLQGAEIAASAASFGTFAGRASYGRSLGSDGDVLVSATLSDSEGQRLYFPEYDFPSSNDGISDAGADRESFRKLLATASKGPFAFQASHVSREKGIPTGAYGTLFNDQRTRTIDQLSLASVTFGHNFSGGTSLSTRIHGGHWNYEGAYSYDAAVLPGEDHATGQWWGIDVDAGRAWGRHFFTIGSEYRNNFRQDQKTFEVEPAFVYADLQNASARWGLFAQDEIKILPTLTLTGGVRYDRYESFGSMISPRLGLIYSPTSKTTIKALAGRAFRAPNEFELHYDSELYTPNPRLRPERIETLELIGQRLLGGGVLVSASGFRNRLSALISQIVDASDNDRLVFDNADEIESRGFELGLGINRGTGLSGQLTYSLQRTEDRGTRAELTNSPRHVAQLRVIAPLGRGFTAGLDASRGLPTRSQTDGPSRTRGWTPGLVLLWGVFLAAAGAFAQGAGEEAEIKAAFVYNFLKFVEWPADAFQRAEEPLVVAIVGVGPTAEATARFLAPKQVGGRQLIVRRVGWDEPLTGVHAVFVTESDARKLRRILEAASSRSILSIGEGASFASSGGLIGLVIEERKVRFDIDMAVADATRLKVSSKLLALTRIVHPARGDRGRQ